MGPIDGWPGRSLEVAVPPPPKDPFATHRDDITENRIKTGDFAVRDLRRRSPTRSSHGILAAPVHQTSSFGPLKRSLAFLLAS